MEFVFKKIGFYFKEFIYRNVSARRVFWVMVLTYLVYGVILLIVIPELMAFTGGQPIFNILPFGYSDGYVNEILLKMGEEGRKAYMYHLVPIDIFFPFLFAYGNSILVGYLLNRLQALNGRFIYLCLIPVFASWFDYLENLGVMTMLIKYPDVTDPLIQFCNFFSVAKSLLVTLNFVMLLVILFLIWKRKKLLYDRRD